MLRNNLKMTLMVQDLNLMVIYGLWFEMNRIEAMNMNWNIKTMSDNQRQLF